MMKLSSCFIVMFIRIGHVNALHKQGLGCSLADIRKPDSGRDDLSIWAKG